MSDKTKLIVGTLAIMVVLIAAFAFSISKPNTETINTASVNYELEQLPVEYENEELDNDLADSYSLRRLKPITPEIPKCQDTDKKHMRNGKDKYIKGRTCAGSICEYDTCSSDTLTEYFCSSKSTMSSRTYDCVGRCVKGACTFLK